MHTRCSLIVIHFPSQHMLSMEQVLHARVLCSVFCSRKNKIEHHPLFNGLGNSARSLISSSCARTTLSTDNTADYNEIFLPLTVLMHTRIHTERRWLSSVRLRSWRATFFFLLTCNVSRWWHCEIEPMNTAWHLSIIKIYECKLSKTPHNRSFTRNQSHCNKSICFVSFETAAIGRENDSIQNERYLFCL